MNVDVEEWKIISIVINVIEISVIVRYSWRYFIFGKNFLFDFVDFCLEFFLYCSDSFFYGFINFFIIFLFLILGLCVVGMVLVD